MKKIMTLALVAAGATIMTSCGQGKAKIVTMEDSLAYSVGVDMGTGVSSFDSTLNVDVLCQAIKDVFAKNPQMTPEQAQSFIGEYMSVGLVRKMQKESTAYLAAIEKESGVQKTESGLLYKITAPGSDVKAAVGDSVTVGYVLSLPSGKILQETTAGEPVGFVLEPNALIKAWIEGMPLVGEGGKITLYAPASLAYGDQGRPGISPGQALKFDIELVSVSKK